MKIDYKTKISIKFAQVTYNLIKIPYIIDNMLIYNRLLIAKRGNIGMIHIIVCEDSDMFI